MTERQANAPPNGRNLIWTELAGLLGLFALAVFFLSVSWRKWPDPLIDFGHELYTPWRLAHGAVLYRDVDSIYGPLAQYFNAALFAIFKPGLMVLVAANLVIFAAIVALLYLLCRRAWGIGAAWSACAVFIAIFGFSQLVGIGNYNYATPYAHEVTHGLLLCLALVFVFIKWIARITWPRAFVIGLLLGLTALLKIELLFSAAIVTLVAVWQLSRCYSRPNLTMIGAWGAGVVLPTITFTAYFSIYFPVRTAFAFTSRGWLAAITTTRFTTDPVQIGFLGFDHPWTNLGQHAFATLSAIALIWLIVCVAWWTERIRKQWLSILLATIATGGLVILSRFVIGWWNVGRCLLGLVLIYLLALRVISLFGNSAEQDRDTQFARQMVALLAAALMARMVLNGRIYQFGFYQAALAAVVVVAVLVGELPSRFSLTRRSRVIFLLCVCALLGQGVDRLVSQSIRQLQMKALPVGEGLDRFYVFPPALEPEGKLVSVISEGLRTDRHIKTLAVLPEGDMINYLARLPSTITQFVFFSFATEAGGEEKIVSQLERAPPDAIVVISRNLNEYGIRRYGEAPGKGELLLHWVDDNYNQVAHFGGDPFDYRQRGALIFKHR